MIEVKRSERGWAGHFICAHRCRFRRNTLLEAGDTRIVVSSVGLMEDPLGKGGNPGFTTIGHNRHFETMAFHAKHDGRYWDANVSRGEISFNSEWAISDLDADDRANDMHEAVVREFVDRLASGETFPTDHD
jgi:hypothetical protein